jgi:hypothetical protein
MFKILFLLKLNFISSFIDLTGQKNLFFLFRSMRLEDWKTHTLEKALSLYLILFFSRFATFFSRFYVRSLKYSYVFSDPNIHFRTEVRSYPKNVPTFFLKLEFLKRRTAGRPRDCAWHFDTKFSRNWYFDRDRIWLGPAVLCRTGPSQPAKMDEKSRGANLQVCCLRDGLGLANPTSRSRQPLGQASFLPGRVGKGVISGKLEKKVLSAVAR